MTNHPPNAAPLLIPGPIQALKGLSLAARSLLALALATGDATATNTYYAKRLGYSRLRIQRAMAELEGRGYVARDYTLPPVRRRHLHFAFPT